MMGVAELIHTRENMVCEQTYVLPAPPHPPPQPKFAFSDP